MKLSISFGSVLCLAAFAHLPQSTAASSQDPTYVVPIKGMIERGLVYVVRRAVAQAKTDGAGAIVLDMDTPGGRLDATEEIINTITDVDATTYTFVNPNAISAGAITAFATDHIYMAPGGRIGDAMPIMMSPLPMGGPQEMPEGLKEKAVSPTVALIRSAAQRKGHDPKLAEAMVRPEVEYKAGDKLICPSGQLLTLTARDAAQPVGEDKRPLLSRGIVKNMDELLEAIGRSRNPVVYIAVRPEERIARFIEGFPVSGLLLALGLLCLYIEFKTPGFGVPGIAGIVLLSVWFWGHHIAGLAGVVEIVVFVLGVVLLFVELFITPGFGALGVSGITLMATSLLMAMVEHYPGTPWFRLPKLHIQDSIENLGLALILTFAAGAALARFLPRTSVFHKLMLAASVGANDGYTASQKENEDLVGLRGVAAGPLHPAGIGMFGDRRLNVVARGSFIDSGAQIIVAEVHGNRIVVEAPTASDSWGVQTKA